ncbi:MAG TPA: IPT/TIG domain-containing protein, partial [Fimbriimonadaceae bacterium]|nr:IPT/TIG domain-containing protein [Fimbriimonadaceae bacterium]
MRSICSLLSLALASVAVSATVTSFNKPVITRSGRLAITGTGFGSWVEGNRVRLGSTSLIITTWSDTRIVAYVPENTPVGTRQLVVEAASVVSKPRLLKVIARPPLGNRTKWRFEADDYYIMTRFEGVDSLMKAM